VFFPGTPVSSNNKTDSHDTTEILLKVALNILALTPVVAEIVSFGSVDMHLFR
jgi:hypothetical protein